MGQEMSDESESEIEIFKCLNYLRDNAKKMAQAKANRVYMEEARKSMKAVMMKKAEEAGHKSAAIQEREAYSSDDYLKHIEALRIAVQEEERFRWLMIAAQSRVTAWQTIEATRRLEMKVIP